MEPDKIKQTQQFVLKARAEGVPDVQIMQHLAKQGLLQQIAPEQYGNVRADQGLQTSSQQPDLSLVENTQTEDKVGLGRKAFDAVTGGIQGFGESIGQAIQQRQGKQLLDESSKQFEQTTGNLITALREARQQNNTEAVSRLEQAMVQHMENAPNPEEFIPLLNKTPKQIIGEAVETGVMATAGGLLQSGGKSIMARKLAPGVIAQSGIAGAGIAGAGTAQKDGDIGQILGSALIGGTIGAGTAGAIGLAGRGVTAGLDALKVRTLAGKELAKMMSNPNSPISQRMAQITGDVPIDQIVKRDPAIQEAIRQGVDGPTAFMAKHSTDATKQQLSKMFTTSKINFNNPAGKAHQQAVDVVGESVVQRTQHTFNQLGKVGKELDTVAQGLQGQRANFTSAQSQFNDGLAKAGIKVKNGKLDFKGSDFEGIAPAERAITRIWERAQRLGDNAYEGHRLKRFIDNNVSYGKDVGGLTGQAERLVKQFRAGVDGTLDTAFPQYNQVNMQYAKLKGITDEATSLLGKDIGSGDIASKMKAGQITERITSKSPNRGRILKLLNEMDELGAQTGRKFDDDIITQVAFLDSLEDLFGPRAAGTLRAQVGKAEQDIARDVAGELVGSAFTKEGRRNLLRRTYAGLRGVSAERRSKALEDLISTAQ
jgi:hypothetical protein